MFIDVITRISNITGSDDNSLRQICRCSDLVCKAACKLAGLPADLTMSGSTAELKLIMQGISVLTDPQRAQVGVQISVLRSWKVSAWKQCLDHCCRQFY